MKQEANIFRYIFFSKLATNDGRRKDGIRRCEACGYDQGGDERKPRKKTINETLEKVQHQKKYRRLASRSGLTCTYDPAECHGWHDHIDQTLPMFGRIRFRQLNANSEQTNREHHTQEFECDDVLHLQSRPPCPRIKPPCAMWTYDHSKGSTQNYFANIQLRETIDRYETIQGSRS